MESRELCMGCMSVLGDAGICPGCGWVRGTRPDSSLHLEPGTILNGKYLLGRVLGQGGFGITYIGYDLYLDRKLAIKEYFPREYVFREKCSGSVSFFSDATRSNYGYGLEKFLEEGRTLARLEGHPNIVAIQDFFKANETAYLVMSYVEGLSFSEYLKKSNHEKSFTEIFSIMMPVMDALRSIHQIKLLHRDISPDNIYITLEGRVIILDFGAARQALGENNENLSVILKPGFAPEEQYRRNGIQGPWTDIYAVGATIYFALTGIMPPDSLDRLESDTLASPSQLGVLISQAEEQILLKALAVKAPDRYQSIEDMIDDFSFAERKSISEEERYNQNNFCSNGNVTDSGNGDTVLREQVNGDFYNRGARLIKPLSFESNRKVSAITIGRAADNDLVLSNPSVSRYHARLKKNKGSWYIEDLGSTHGTYHNGVIVTELSELKPSSSIRIGDTVFGFDGKYLLDEYGKTVIFMGHRKNSVETKIFQHINKNFLLVLLFAVLILGSGLIWYLPVIKKNKELSSLEYTGEDIPVSGTLTSETIDYRGGLYRGELKNGLPHGYGTIVFHRELKSLDFSEIITPSGDQTYSGQWFEGKMHGEGIMTYSDGSRRSGLWENDQYIGQK